MADWDWGDNEDDGWQVVGAEPKPPELSSTEAFITGIKGIPRNIATTAIGTFQGASGASVADQSFLDRWYKQQQDKNIAEQAKFKGGFVPGIKDVDVVRGIQGLPYTGLAITGGVAGGVAGQATAIPGAQVAGGIAGSSLLTHRATSYDAMNRSLERLNEINLKETGQPITLDQENQFKELFDDDISGIANWESGTEAASTMIELAIYGFGGKSLPPAVRKKAIKAATELFTKRVAKGIAGNVKKGAGTLITEVAEEVVSDIGGGNIERRIWNEEEEKWDVPTILETAREVAPTVAVTAGALHGAGTVAGAVRDRGAPRAVAPTDETNRKLGDILARDKVQDDAGMIESITNGFTSGDLTRGDLDALAESQPILKPVLNEIIANKVKQDVDDAILGVTPEPDVDIEVEPEIDIQEPVLPKIEEEPLVVNEPTKVQQAAIDRQAQIDKTYLPAEEELDRIAFDKKQEIERREVEKKRDKTRDSEIKEKQAEIKPWKMGRDEFDKISKYHHGTDEKSLLKIEAEGIRADVLPEDRKYSYGQFGPNNVYLSSAGKGKQWLDKEWSKKSRAVGYDKSLPVVIKKNANIVEINSTEEADLLARRAGFKDFEDAEQATWFDAYDIPKTDPSYQDHFEPANNAKQKFLDIGIDGFDIKKDVGTGDPQVVILNPSIIQTHKQSAKQAIKEGKIKSHPDYPELTIARQEQSVTPKKIKDVETKEIPIEQIKHSKELPQFKEGAGEKGIVDALSGEYERVGTPPIVLWERKNGDLEVITGRHRLDLAQKQGEKTIPSQILKEADGFTAEQAAIFDVESNIRDEKGSVRDYATFFRSAEITEKQASGRGLLSRAKGKSGFAIGANAGNDLYSAYRNKAINENKAVAIANAAPGNNDLQNVGMRYADKHTTDEIKNYLKAVKAIKPTATGKQISLFGEDERWQIEADKMAVAVTAMEKEAKQELSLLKSAGKLDKTKHKEFLDKYGIDAGNTKAIAERVKVLEGEVHKLNNWAAYPNVVADVKKRAGIVEPKKTTPKAPQKLNYTQFAEEYGYISDYDITDHAALSPSGQDRVSERQKKELNKRLEDRIKSNKEGHAAYINSIKEGRVIDPSGKITKESIAKAVADSAKEKLETEIRVAEQGINFIKSLGKTAHTKSGRLKIGYQRTVDDYQKKIDDAKKILGQDTIQFETAKTETVSKPTLGVVGKEKQKSKDQSLTTESIKKTFGKMKNVSTGQDKDGNVWFKFEGFPRHTILEMDSINNRVGITDERQRTGAFLQKEKQVWFKTGGTGAKADVGSLHHENWHLFKRMGVITEPNLKAIHMAINRKGHKGKITEETEASFIGDAAKSREYARNTRIGRILQKIGDFLDAMINLVATTSKKVVRGVESGKIVGRQDSTDKRVEPKAAALTEGAPLFEMAGEKAIGADKGALFKAQKMIAEGADKKDVWKETGWLKSKEGAWKFEIDDSGSKIKQLKGWFGAATTDSANLSDVLLHTKLYKAYPQLKDVQVKITNNKTTAFYDAGKKIIGFGAWAKSKNKKWSTVRETLLHEVSHVIQHIEGFARGGSPGSVDFNAIFPNDKKMLEYQNDMDNLSFDGKGWDSKEMLAIRKEMDDYAKNALIEKYGKDYGMTTYKSLAGEIEARDVSSRARLTPEERRDIYPYLSQGIPEEQWIIKDGSGTSFDVEDKEDIPIVEDKLFREITTPSAGKELPFRAPTIKGAIKKAIDIGGGKLSPNSTARAAMTRHLNDAMYWIVDKNRPINTVQTQLDKVSDDMDVFLKETMRPKRTAARIKTAWDDEVKPMVEQMSKAKINIQDLELYKHALHAREANAALRRSNAKMQVEKIIKILKSEKKNDKVDAISETVKGIKTPDKWFDILNKIIAKYGSETSLQDNLSKWKDFSDKPSGMSDKEAAKILKRYSTDKNIEKVGRMLDSINANSLALLFNSGQISEEEYSAIMNKYEHYVPLHREGHSDRLFGATRGLRPSGRAVKVRGGSTRNVVNIVANSISNYEKAINRAEKAISQRALKDLVEANPDSDVLSISPVKKSPQHDDYGNLRAYPDLFNVDDNEMRLMVGGEQFLVSAQRDNPDAMLMMRTLKAEDGMSGPIVNTLSKLNRFLSRINTSWSPEFIVSNFVRDIQTAGINIKDTGVKGKGMLRGAKDAWKAIYATEREKPKGTELEGLYGRFKAAGGKIGWADVHGSVEGLSKKITSELRILNGEMPIRKRVKQWLDLIEDVNTSIENGIRLHVFKLAVEQGKTDERAAQIASDLTVDFTKKGAAGPVINALYLFANASIQGTYRIMRAGAKSKEVRRMMAGIVGAGFTVGMLNAIAGGEDEDGEDYYNKIEDYVRERNMIFMLPGTKGKYVKIPLPWGYNVFWNAGSEISRAFTKENYSPLAGAGRMAGTFANAFNPMAAGTLLQSLSPTVTDPFVQVAENKNWFGGDLMPERNKFDKTPDPDSQRFWRSTGAISKEIALQLNKLTGGDKIKPGLIDISPETIDLVVDTLGGSALRFVKDTIGIPEKAIRGEEIEMSKIPFVRRVAGKKSKWTDSRIFYENLEHILMAKEQLKFYKNDQNKVSSLRKEKALVPIAKASEKKLRKLRKELRRARAFGNKVVIQKREAEIEKAYVSFNKQYSEKMK